MAFFLPLLVGGAEGAAGTGLMALVTRGIASAAGSLLGGEILHAINPAPTPIRKHGKRRHHQRKKRR
jgi:hypothetical protein